MSQVGGKVLLASNEKKSGMMLYILQCTGQSPKQRITWPPNVSNAKDEKHWSGVMFNTLSCAKLQRQKLYFNRVPLHNTDNFEYAVWYETKNMILVSGETGLNPTSSTF